MIDTAPHKAVRVVASARLHLGFLNPGSDEGRQFGGIGLALDAPTTALTLAAGGPGIAAEGPDAPRAADYLARVLDRLGLRPAHRLWVEAAVPAHAGLGSGTQLALATAAAARALATPATPAPVADPRADAAALGRGARSGIGLALFAQGGLVLDGGVPPAAASPPPLLARLAVPEDWRVILVQDTARAGLSGKRERAAFADLPPFPAEASAALCRLVLLQVLPAVAEADLPAFGDGLTRLQARLGEHFAPAQGGRFTSPRVAAACAALARAGATGIGQSSWGPTGFAFAQADAAPAVIARATAALRNAPDLDIQLRRPCNSGARIERITLGAPPRPAQQKGSHDGR